MKSNMEILDDLFEKNAIALERGAVFDTPVGPKPAGFDFDRIEGMLLGAAVGDSLGCTSEGMGPRSRRGRYGEVRNYLPHRHGPDARGYPSDDTQLTFWTLEQLIEDGRFVPEHAAALTRQETGPSCGYLPYSYPI